MLKQALSLVRHPDIQWIGFREVREAVTYRGARDGKPAYNQTEISHGVMVEVLVDGQFGYAATPALDVDSLVKAAERARAQAKAAAQFKVFGFTEAQRPPVKARYTSPIQKKAPSAAEINDTLVKITEKLKVSPKIVRATSMVLSVDTHVRFVSSNGADGEQQFHFISTDFVATAQDGAVVQRRGGMKDTSYQGGFEYFETPDLWERVDRVAQESLELLAAEECPTETMDLVLMPDQMMLQIHESIGHPLELDRILGDERNYAGWSFVKLEDFGKLQYGSPLMNVAFDPTVREEFASYAFDDTGNPAKRELLIENGKLKRGLGSLESQIRSRVPGVANQRASLWNRPPIDRMANLNLEPGTSSFDEIIGSVKHGVLMESNRSWSIDDFRNKFQFGCEYGKLIENGKITRTIRNPNYRGVTVPFWTSLKAVGSTETMGCYGTPNCGKGEPNQAIRVGHRSPVCLFSDIEVFGGAS